MGEQPRATPPSAKPPDGRLDSWKEVAAYLNRDVTTVQRWEKREGMPVHRHLHDRVGSIYAFRSELDAWVRSRKLAATEESNADVAPSVSLVQTPVPPSRDRRGPAIVFLVAVAVAAAAAILWWQRTEHLWRSPIADAHFQTLTDFDGVAQSAAISRDGHFVAFLSDRDGHMDVWVTQLGTGQFHNLTNGRIQDLSNLEVRCVGFSPDGSQVAFWVRKQDAESSSKIGIWAVPTLGGTPKVYLDGIAESDWSSDGTRLVYHTPGPGDPLFVTDGRRRGDEQSIYTAPAGLHSHFPTWGPGSRFIYFVHGALPDKLDLWRIRPTGGSPEQITTHATRVTYPVFLDRRTLLYLASDPDGSGPWIHSMDVERRISHRLTTGLDHYTSLAASADGRKVIATLANLKETLWRVPFGEQGVAGEAARVSIATGTGFFPRMGPNYLLHVSATSNRESLWKEVGGTASELWSVHDVHVLGAPAISRDGKSIAFSAKERGKSVLYAMQSDGANVRMVTVALDLQGSPAWAPDGRSILTGANDRGVPHLYRVPLDGGSPTLFVREHALDPAWSEDGRFLVYSGPDIGTTFGVRAVKEDGTPFPIPALTLTRGARHLAFLPGRGELLVLRGDTQHKDLWAFDLENGKSRQLSHFGRDFNISDFELSPDGRELVVERTQERSEVVLMEVPAR